MSLSTVKRVWRITPNTNFDPVEILQTNRDGINTHLFMRMEVSSEDFKGLTYCNATFDSFLCWPPTEAGTMAFQNCPAVRLSDTSRLAFRRCGLDGLWLGRRKNESSIIGWTNYTPCFPTEVQTLFGKVYDDEADPQAKFQIAQNTRYLEIIGFSLSLIALLISLYLFVHFRALKNTRTLIHRNLFLAMITQVIIRLILYFDQALMREESNDSTTTLRGLDSMPYVCEACYMLLEYAISAMFNWMWIEGLYLHNVVTANALRERITYTQYCLIGWGLPVVVTSAWAAATAVHYQNTSVLQCWYGYNFLAQYWIVQGPRLGVVVINLLFLLNIMRVLIVKLQRTENSEIERVRKAVRAALVLLPLLGITNVLNMIEAPLDGSVWRFGAWSYSTHFLQSFQGFFIAVIYCFLNAEVRQIVEKHYRDWVNYRNVERRMRETSLHLNRIRRSGEAEETNRHDQPLEWMCYPDQAASDEIEMKGECGLKRSYNEPDNVDMSATRHVVQIDADTNVTVGD